VCTGALILSAAGSLRGGRRPRTKRARDELRAVADIVEARVVEDGLVTTAGGVTASIDLGLHILEKHFGPELAREVEERIEYQRPCDPKRTRKMTCDGIPSSHTGSLAATSFRAPSAGSPKS